MSAENPTQMHATGEATGFIPTPGDKGKPITVIGTNSIRAGFDATKKRSTHSSVRFPFMHGTAVQISGIPELTPGFQWGFWSGFSILEMRLALDSHRCCPSYLER